METLTFLARPILEVLIIILVFCVISRERKAIKLRKYKKEIEEGRMGILHQIETLSYDMRQNTRFQKVMDEVKNIVNPRINDIRSISACLYMDNDNISIRMKARSNDRSAVAQGEIWEVNPRHYGVDFSEPYSAEAFIYWAMQTFPFMAYCGKSYTVRDYAYIESRDIEVPLFESISTVSYQEHSRKIIHKQGLQKGLQE